MQNPFFWVCSLVATGLAEAFWDLELTSDFGISILTPEIHPILIRLSVTI